MVLSLCFFVVAAQVITNNSIYLPYPEEILLATTFKQRVQKRSNAVIDPPFLTGNKEKGLYE